MTDPAGNKPTRTPPPPSTRQTTPASPRRSSVPVSRSALATAQSKAPPAPRHQYHPDAKISFLAALGAVWGSLFFLMLILSAARGNTLILPEIRPPMWHALLDYVIQPLGWSAPFATSVLGLVAIGRIQKSDGRIYGLSLALFDALLFPLLVLDFAIVWLCRQGAAALIQQDVVSPAVASAVLAQAIPIIAIILGDYYLATRAWSAIQPEEPQ